MGFTTQQKEQLISAVQQIYKMVTVEVVSELEFERKYNSGHTFTIKIDFPDPNNPNIFKLSAAGSDFFERRKSFSGYSEYMDIDTSNVMSTSHLNDILKFRDEVKSIYEKTMTLH